MPDEETAPTSGLASQLADHFRAATIEANEHRSGLAREMVNEWLEAHEGDLAAFARGAIGHVLDNEDLPGHVREALVTMMHPEHQAQFFIALFAVQGIISNFVMAAVQPDVQAIANRAWTKQPDVPLTPSEAALAVLKGAMGEPDAIREAAKSGVDIGPFEILRKITGEPISLQEGLLLYRRGQMSAGRLQELVRQSRIRPEWLPEILDLRYAPPSPAEVISGTVEGHLDRSKAEELFQEAGINPEHFEWMFETAGRPPGMMQMLTLLNRGLASEAQVVQAIRESNVKNKYTDALLQLRYRIPPQRTIVSMLRHGVITDAKASEWMRDLGYHADAIALFLKEGHETKMAAEKELALGTIKSLYQDRIIDRDRALAAIDNLGYDAHEADLILQIVEVARARRYLNAAVARVHTLYVGHRLTRHETGVNMDRLGIDPQEKEDLLTIWDLEREANQRDLTLAQIQGAARRGVIDRPTFDDRAHQLGYTNEDIPILYELSFPPSEFKGPQP